VKQFGIISHRFYAVEIALFKIQQHKTYVKYLNFKLYYQQPVAYPGILFGAQQIQLRTKDRENGDLGAVAP